MATEAFVYDAIRTPRGRGKQTGSLHEARPVSLLVGLIHEIQRRNPGLDPARIEDVVLGVVTPIGDQGAVIARTAALAAGLERCGAGVQINRFCASGLEAVNMAAGASSEPAAVRRSTTSTSRRRCRSTSPTIARRRAT